MHGLVALLAIVGGHMATPPAMPLGPSPADSVYEAMLGAVRGIVRQAWE